MRYAPKRSIRMNKFLIIPKAAEIEKSLELAREYDLGFEFNDFFLPDMLDDPLRTEERIAFYRKWELPETLTSHGAFFDVIIFSYDRRIREVSQMRVRQSVDIARRIVAKGVVFHTNYQHEFLAAGNYRRDWLDSNEKFWRETAENNADIEIYIENMCDRSPELITELARRLSGVPNFGLCFDYAHACVYGSDIDNWAKSVAPYTKHLHINDNDLKDDLHLAVGSGKIDWERFKAHLSEYFPNQSVLIETSDISAQRRSAEFLRKLGALS